MAALFLVSGPVIQAATYTWTGSASSDWFNTNNWSPTGQPGSNDTVNFNSGTINLTAPVTINSQFNWAGGTLSGSALTVTANGVLSLSGSAAKYLESTVTNAGTLAYTGSGSLYLYNNLTTYHGAIWNLPSGVLNIGTDLSVNCACYGYEFINNQGTIEKTAGTGSSYLSVVVTNTGAVLGMQGTLCFNAGGTVGRLICRIGGRGDQFQQRKFQRGRGDDGRRRNGGADGRDIDLGE